MATANGQARAGGDGVNTMNGHRLCQAMLVLAAIGTIGTIGATNDAWAGRGGFGHHGSHFRARVGVGISIGPGFVYGYPGYVYPAPYYYSPGYYPPVVASSPQYIEQGPDGNPVAVPDDAAAPAQTWWYRCDRPAGYYPYVKDCPGGWQQVPAQPPAGGSSTQREVMP